MRDYNFYVYIVTNRRNGVLYTGVTNSLERRLYQHRDRTSQSFTRRYDVSRLVYYEHYFDIRDAIAREKQIKGWLRSKKLALIERFNPAWRDLSSDWG